jgi:predicted Zn-ribbon and HTH transcriptional regulator
MPATIDVRLDLEPTDCINCGVWFAVPSRLLKAQQRDGKDFYCPNGHPMVYRDSEIAWAKRHAAEAQAEAAQLRALKVQLENDLLDQAREIKTLKRARNRLHAGVCDQCQRTFSNLQRHMADKHPTTAGVHRAAAHQE